MNGPDREDHGLATVRQQLMDLLGHDELTAREVSQALSIPEKEVYEHLDHISRTLTARGKRLWVRPYRCLACGYTFQDRPRFTRPGRCPRCKGGHIRQAAFRVTG